ncbi:serine/threonine protein kinase [Thiobacillus denitrificans]|uniref:non-specific serine/threonine protein kinase n=2 Tax=Thiobacillus denitrificans TaxID=36861 RepID=A0A106BPB0_THIDE|nr:serine/threonine protein kinase [Thiobacillus denitrificans]
MKIGRYEILDEVGQGAMGTVYRARDPLIERTVAIKTVPIAQLRQEGADAESRFLREAQSAGRLSHPNIVTIYDVGETDGLAYIAMEYLPGATLRDIMDKGPMPLDLVLDTATQMAGALAFAHEHGVIHRDIKPSNVVVTGRGGRVKLTDFGIAHLLNSEHTQTGQMLGSPRYMSPEQAMGREIDGRSDIFSLGAVLYEMLTGQYAFDGGSLPAIVYRVIHEAPAPATSLRAQLPGALASLLTRMLDKNPQTRPDARALVNALHALVPAAPHVPAPLPSNRISRLLPMLAFGTPVAVFLLIGVGIIVIGYFIAPAPQPQPVSPPTSPPVSDSQDAAPQPAEDAATDSQPSAGPTETARPTQKLPGEADAYLTGLDKKQVELRIMRTELLLQYTEQHPDVMQVDRQLEQLRIERRRYLQQLQKN